MLFWVMNPHQRCLQAKVKYWKEPKQVMPKSEDLSRSLEINAIWTFVTEFPTIFNESCTYITFQSAVYNIQFLTTSLEPLQGFASNFVLMFLRWAPTKFVNIGVLPLFFME